MRKECVINVLTPLCDQTNTMASIELFMQDNARHVNITGRYGTTYGTYDCEQNNDQIKQTTTVIHDRHCHRETTRKSLQTELTWTTKTITIGKSPNHLCGSSEEEKPPQPLKTWSNNKNRSSNPETTGSRRISTDATTGYPADRMIKVPVYGWWKLTSNLWNLLHGPAEKVTTATNTKTHKTSSILVKKRCCIRNKKPKSS